MSETKTTRVAYPGDEILRERNDLRAALTDIRENLDGVHCDCHEEGCFICRAYDIARTALAKLDGGEVSRAATGLNGGESRSRDFSVTNHGTIFLLDPLTPAAHAWLTLNIVADAPQFGRALAVEHRYIRDIVDGIVNDGLTVE